MLCDSQHRFHQKHSCESQLITAINNLAKCLNEKGQCDVRLLDFGKALDKVVHLHLLKKLYHYGIRGIFLLWLKCFLTDRSQYVTLHNQRSHIIPVAWVPQGTVLCPLLFFYISMAFPLEYTPKWNFTLTMHCFILILNLKLTVIQCKKIWKHSCNGHTIGKCSLPSINGNS